MFSVRCDASAPKTAQRSKWIVCPVSSELYSATARTGAAAGVDPEDPVAAAAETTGNLSHSICQSQVRFIACELTRREGLRPDLTGRVDSHRIRCLDITKQPVKEDPQTTKQRLKQSTRSDPQITINQPSCLVCSPQAPVSQLGCVARRSDLMRRVSQPRRDCIVCSKKSLGKGPRRSQ